MSDQGGAAAARPRRAPRARARARPLPPRRHAAQHPRPDERGAPICAPHTPPGPATLAPDLLFVPLTRAARIGTAGVGAHAARRRGESGHRDGAAAIAGRVPRDPGAVREHVTPGSVCLPARRFAGFRVRSIVIASAARSALSRRACHVHVWCVAIAVSEIFRALLLVLARGAASSASRRATRHKTRCW